MYQIIRAFFGGIDYLEVDTPVLGIATSTDSHIESVRAVVNAKPYYLQTSPEFFMKRLLAEGCGSIFQICHAFRDEENGNRHAAEFTLLEWYSVGFDYMALMVQLEQLVTRLIPGLPSFHRLSYFESFKRYLELDLTRASTDDCRHCVTVYIPGIKAGLLTRDDCLDLLISQVIAKKFDGFTFIYDYPASQASLARIKLDNPLVAERFELFYNDLELANGFSELTDVVQQQQRFENDNAKRRQLGRQACPIDEHFLLALEKGLPDCAGVAVGLDRLLMVMTGLQSIQQVMTMAATSQMR